MSDPKRIIVKTAIGKKDGEGSHLPPDLIAVDVSLDAVHIRLMETLVRETHQLHEISERRLLSKDEGVAFDRCVKVLREFKKEERETADQVDADEPEED